MNRRAPHRRRLVATLIVAALLASRLSAQETPGDLQLALASEAAEVTTKGGRKFRGLLDGMREGRLWIKTARDGGEIGYSFAPGEIGALVLPGAEVEARANEWLDRGLAAEALPLLEALGRQRSRYLPILNAGQRRPLVRLVRVSDAVGDPYTTIGYARVLEPHVESEEERMILRDAVLNAHMRLNLKEEARELAEIWCREADSNGTSALGWMVLARLALDGNNVERARWIALQPIAFSRHRPTAHLDVCYAIAITAAHEGGDGDHARSLFIEMRERHLDWPRDERYAEVGAIYSDPDLRMRAAARVKADSPAPRPRNFEHILKLVAQPLP